MVIPVCIPNKTYENLNSFFFLARFVMDDNPGDKYLLEQTDANLSKKSKAPFIFHISFQSKSSLGNRYVLCHFLLKLRKYTETTEMLFLNPAKLHIIYSSLRA